MGFWRTDLDRTAQMNTCAYEAGGGFTSYAVKCNDAPSENANRSAPAVKGEEAAAV